MAVMGSNLARNLAHKGYKVAIHNRSVSKTEKVFADHGSEGEFYPAESMADFVGALSAPRVAIIMVKAGAPTDAVIEELASLMDEGDIIVDCGNSNYEDTRRREESIRARGLHFVGSGVSGGEEGGTQGPVHHARRHPRILRSPRPHVREDFRSDRRRAVLHPRGPGWCRPLRQVVHNGIEYADMQLIAEAYDLMRKGLRHERHRDRPGLRRGNKGELGSYLIEITADVLQHMDPKTGQPFVDIVLDRASQKGTGTWTVQNGAKFGILVTVSPRPPSPARSPAPCRSVSPRRKLAPHRRDAD